MPKFAMEDVDKRIEEIRLKYRQPKGTSSSLIAKFREIAKRRRGSAPSLPQGVK